MPKYDWSKTTGSEQGEADKPISSAVCSLTLGLEILLLIFMGDSKKELELLNEIKDDAKHPQLSKLIKQSAIFQSALARENGIQTTIHLVISLLAVAIATVIPLSIGPNKVFHWFSSPKSEEVKTEKEKTENPQKDTNKTNPQIGEHSQIGDDQTGGGKKPQENPINETKEPN